MINIAVIGLGYWGPNLVRNFFEVEECRVTHICDRDVTRLKSLAVRYPNLTVTTDAADVLNDSAVDAIAIATPVGTHKELGLTAMRAGKHVLMEKPLAAGASEARELVEVAESRNVTLLVDHTFPYTGAVRKIKELIDRGDLGRVRYYDSVRVNLGIFQSDVSVLWDLAVHDLSIMDLLVDERPVSVSATGRAHVEGQPESVVYLTLFYKTNLIAHIHVNWLSPVKVRKTLIGGTDRMILYDDLEPTEKVKVYDAGIHVENDPESIWEMRVGYRSGDIFIPQIDRTEALLAVCQHFVDCITTGAQPRTSGPSGLRVVEQLEAASKSLALDGQPVEI